VSSQLDISSYLEHPAVKPQVEFDPARGRMLAEQGMSEAMRAERVQLWKDDADAWLQANRGAALTADILVDALGYLPDVGPNRVNVVGAWFSAQAKRGKIVSVGEMVRSQRPDRHVGLQRLWRVV
jgi:hypothetical protein